MSDKLVRLKNQIVSVGKLITAYSFQHHLMPLGSSNQIDESQLIINKSEVFMKIGKANDYLDKKIDEFNEEFAVSLASDELPQIPYIQYTEGYISVFYYQDSISAHHEFVIANLMATTNFPIKLHRYFACHVPSKNIPKHANEHRTLMTSKYKYAAINDFLATTKNTEFACIFPSNVLVGDNWLEDLMTIKDFPSIGFCTIPKYGDKMYFISIPNEESEFPTNSKFLISTNNLFNGLCFFQPKTIANVAPLPRRKFVESREIQVLSYHASIDNLRNVAIINQFCIEIQSKTEMRHFDAEKLKYYLKKLKIETNKKLRNE